MAKKREVSKPSAELWYVSYGDLVTNMLCFFVMMFAYSTFDTPPNPEERLGTLGEHLMNAFAVFDVDGTHRHLLKGQGALLLKPSAKPEEAPRIVKEVRDKLLKVPMSNRMKVISDDQIIKIQIPANVLFDSGQATMKQGAEEFLTGLVPVLGQLDNYIRIDGHTDNEPPRVSVYQSNWELSAVRASAVVRFFTEKMHLDPERFSAQGFGEFRPEVPNVDKESREKNRRVEIVILNRKKIGSRGATW